MGGGLEENGRRVRGEWEDGGKWEERWEEGMRRWKRGLKMKLGGKKVIGGRRKKMIFINKFIGEIWI